MKIVINFSILFMNLTRDISDIKYISQQWSMILNENRTGGSCNTPYQPRNCQSPYRSVFTGIHTPTTPTAPTASTSTFTSGDSGADAFLKYFTYLTETDKLLASHFSGKRLTSLNYKNAIKGAFQQDIKDAKLLQYMKDNKNLINNSFTDLKLPLITPTSPVEHFIYELLNVLVQALP